MSRRSKTQFLPLAAVAGLLGLLLGAGLLFFRAARSPIISQPQPLTQPPSTSQPGSPPLPSSRLPSASPPPGGLAGGIVALHPPPLPRPLPPPPPPAPLDFSQIDAVLKGMPKANIAFNVPSEMILEQPSEIRLLLSRNKTPQQLAAEINRVIREQGAPQRARISVSNEMEARLTGQNFEIKAATPETQAVSEVEETLWQWDVRATKEGTQQLHLTLSAILSVNSSPVPRAIDVFDQTIEVKVTWGQRISGFVTRNWKWLWTVILIPIGRWLWKRRKRRKKHAPAPAKVHTPGP